MVKKLILQTPRVKNIYFYLIPKKKAYIFTNSSKKKPYIFTTLHYLMHNICIYYFLFVLTFIFFSLFLLAETLMISTFTLATDLDIIPAAPSF